MSMRAGVLGIGLRAAATRSSLEEVLAMAGAAEGLVALATLEDKAGHPALLAFARHLNLPIRPVPRDALAGLATLTRSCRIEQGFGTGSVAEACALAVAGPGARLITPRITAPDGLVTLAIAQGTFA